MRLFVIAALVLGSCRKDVPTEVAKVEVPPRVPTVDDLQASERRAMERDARRECRNAKTVYDGGARVQDTTWVHTVDQNGEYVEEAISGLDDVIAKGKSFTFTLDYPFEKPFTGRVEGELTRRKAIDAIRAGFRKMFEVSKIEDIPGMANKRVTGPYGEGFHEIGDLYIEHIELCDGSTLQISMGS